MARREHVSAEVVGQDFVLHDGTTGKVHFLNATAALIWDLCDGKHNLDELCAVVGARFTRSPESLRDDVAAALRGFVDEHLLLPPGAA